MCCAVLYHLYSSKNVKIVHEECDQALYKPILKSTVQLFLHWFNLLWLWWSDCWCQYYFSLVDNVLQIYWYGWYLQVWLEIDWKMVFIIPKCTTWNVTEENMGNCWCQQVQNQNWIMKNHFRLSKKVLISTCFILKI